MSQPNRPDSDPDADLIICRCEEVTKGEILAAIVQGAHTLWQVRRMTRAGMGLCQGRSCERIGARIMAEALSVPLSEVLTPSNRPPMQPIPIGALAGGEHIELE